MAHIRKTIWLGRELPYQDYELIRDIVLSKRRSAGVKPGEDQHLFVDSAFPPDISSLTYVYSGDDRYDKMCFQRPKAVLPEAVFTGVGGVCDTPFPSNAWKHQDWLRAALIVMSVYVKFLERAIPGYRQFKQSLTEDYTGLYLFRLWRFGHWVDVPVDDFLPILDDKLAYSNAVGSPPELWLPLLEKAYAKCNKAYESIELGRTLDALTDLTGSICEHHRPDVAPPANFFHILYKSCVNRSLMVCWRNEKRLTHTGFHYDTAQTGNPTDSEDVTLDRAKYLHIITAVTKFPTLDGRWEEMVRLKCPYRKEPRWHGKYSDNDRLSWESLNKKFKEKYSPQEQKVADEYWISLEDMRCNFGGIIICSSSDPFSCHGLEAERMYSCDPALNNRGKCGRTGNVDRRKSLNDVFLDDNSKQTYTPKKSGSRRYKDGSQTNALYRNLFYKQTGDVDHTSKCDMFIKDYTRTDNGKRQLQKRNSSGDHYDRNVGKSNSCSRSVTHFVAEASSQSNSNSRSSSGPVTGQCSASDIYVDVQSLSSSLLPDIGGRGSYETQSAPATVRCHSEAINASLQRTNSQRSNSTQSNKSINSLTDCIFLAKKADPFSSEGSWQAVIVYTNHWPATKLPARTLDADVRLDNLPRILLSVTESDAVNENIDISYHGKGHVIISLLQDYRKCKSPTLLLSTCIGFYLYKTKHPERDGHRHLSKLTCVAHEEDTREPREIVRRFDLDLGHYFIVPYCSEVGNGRDFMVRVLAEKDPVASKNGCILC